MNRPRICLCLTASTREGWTQQLRREGAHADMLELRVDLLRPAERSVEALAAWRREMAAGIPVILTVRRSSDLGAWEGDDAQRLFLIGQLLPTLNPEWIDIELDRRGSAGWDALANEQRQRGGAVIRSHHEVRSTPLDIEAIAARLAQDPHEIPKLAVMATSAEDTLRLLQTARAVARRNRDRPGVWIAMGEYGLLSRVAPGIFGSAWTYSSAVETRSTVEDSSAASTGSRVEDSSAASTGSRVEDSPPAGENAAAAAPGHLTPTVLREQYRVGMIPPDAPLLAVLGAPVAHSRSPEFHNRALVADQIGTVYVPIRADRFEDFVTLADEANVVAASVTVPHKEAALRLGLTGGGASDRAQSVGAANTLWRTPGGNWQADNTDVEAFAAPLHALAGDGNGRRAAVIGAGGAARAAIVALLNANWRVAVFNRTVARAEALAAEFGLEGGFSVEALGSDEYSGALALIVQTTPLGMAHGPQGDPAHAYRFSGDEIVYDVIYTPKETELLARARAAGARTLNGACMFELQATAQYRRFREVLTAFPGYPFGDAAASR